MPLWPRRNISVEDVLAEIKSNSDVIREEMRQSKQSNQRMEEVVTGLDRLYDRLRGEVPDA